MIKRVEEKSVVGRLDRAGIHDLLESAGFGIEEEFGNYQGDPFQEQDRILIIQAVRKD